MRLAGGGYLFIIKVMAKGIAQYRAHFLKGTLFARLEKHSMLGIGFRPRISSIATDSRPCHRPDVMIHKAKKLRV